MKTIYLDTNQQAGIGPCVATIGFFDGVHRGHQYLIGHVKALAAERGLKSVVITFDRHPREVLHSDYQPRLLNSTDMKLLMLSRTGVDAVVVLHFTPDLASLSAHDFMAKVLRGQLDVRHLVIGYDNRFGHNRAEGFADYVRYGSELGIEVIQSRAFVLHGINVSSSVVREMLVEGDVERAATCLGYPYTLEGTVVHGQQIGRTMGFPTANIRLSEPHQLVPKSGVYAARVRTKDQMTYYKGMLNIGTRPTFNGDSRTIEVNIFNWSDDLYGRELFVCLQHRVRDERRFDSAEALEQQIEKDKTTIEQLFDNDYETDE